MSRAHVLRGGARSADLMTAKQLDELCGVMAKHGVVRLELEGVVVERPLPPPVDGKGRPAAEEDPFTRFSRLSPEAQEVALMGLRGTGVTRG